QDPYSNYAAQTNEYAFQDLDSWVYPSPQSSDAKSVSPPNIHSGPGPPATGYEPAEHTSASPSNFDATRFSSNFVPPRFASGFASNNSGFGDNVPTLAEGRDRGFGFDQGGVDGGRGGQHDLIGGVNRSYGRYGYGTSASDGAVSTEDVSSMGAPSNKDFSTIGASSMGPAIPIANPAPTSSAPGSFMGPPQVPAFSNASQMYAHRQSAQQQSTQLQRQLISREQQQQQQQQQHQSHSPRTGTNSQNSNPDRRSSICPGSITDPASPVYDLYGSSIIALQPNFDALKLSGASNTYNGNPSVPSEPYDPIGLGLPIPPVTGSGEKNFKGLYSTSGLDMIGILARVVARPNPEIDVGPVDLGCSFLVTDARKFDHPIVYASDTFSRLTGYANDEIIGRNCAEPFILHQFNPCTGTDVLTFSSPSGRFLQSPNGIVEQGSKRQYTDGNAVHHLKRHINSRRETQASLINYAKGGKPFINLVTCIPITWDSDEIAYYVGFQVDLVDQPTAILEKMKNGTYVVNYSVGSSFGPSPSLSVTSGQTGQSYEQHPESTLLTPPLEKSADVSANLKPSIQNLEASSKTDPVMDTKSSEEIIDTIMTKGVASLVSEGERKQFNRLLLENCEDFIHVVSLKGSLLYVSPSASRLLEYEPSDLAGTMLSEICHPSDVVAVLRELKDAGAPGHPGVNVLYRVRRKHSGYLWLEASGKLFHEQSKGRKCVILVGRPREVLQVSWKSLERAGGLAEKEYWSKLSFDGMMLHTTPPVKDCLGYTPDELAGANLATISGDGKLLLALRQMVQAHQQEMKTVHHQMNGRQGVVNVVTNLYPSGAISEDASGIKKARSSTVIAQTSCIPPGSDTVRRIASLPHPLPRSRTSSVSSISSQRSASLSLPLPAFRGRTSDGESSSGSSASSFSAIPSTFKTLTQASSDNIFDGLETTRGTSWQFELHQLRLTNKRLREEKDALAALMRKKRKRETKPDSDTVEAPAGPRSCANCGRTSSAEWRGGPTGPKTRITSSLPFPLFLSSKSLSTSLSTPLPSRFPQNSVVASPRNSTTSSSHEPPTKRARPDVVSPPNGDASTSHKSHLVSLDKDLPPECEPSAITSTLTDDLFAHNAIGPSRQVSLESGTLERRNQVVEVKVDILTIFFVCPRFQVIGIEACLLFSINGLLPRLLPSSDRTPRMEVDMAVFRRAQSLIFSVAPTLSLDILLQHYLTHLHPAFPLLPTSALHALDTLPPAFQTLLITTSFSSLPEYSLASRHLWTELKEERLADRSLDQPRLSSLASALLELGTTLDARGDYGLLAKTIAHAQLLGCAFKIGNHPVWSNYSSHFSLRRLHIDCREWAIPDWEKSLRERIWWCLLIHDSCVQLMSLPSPNDAPEDYKGALSFHYLCRLSVVVGRLQREVSTLERYGKPGRADSCEQLEQELSELKDEVSGQFAVLARPVGMDSFLFLLLGLRAMIRRISIEVQIGLGSSFSPDGDTLAIFTDVVVFFESLGSRSFGAKVFWLSYSAHVMSSLLSSLIRLSLASVSFRSGTPPPSQFSNLRGHLPTTPVRLLGRLCRALYSARNLHQWTVADWALQRAAKVAAQLKQATVGGARSDEYTEVIRALERSPEVEVEVLAPSSIGVEGAGEQWETVTRMETLTAPAVALGFETTDLDAWLNVLDGTPVWGDFVPGSTSEDQWEY
ncbi:hypothetical protein P7C70_g1837, partial [Phenoliferia sp. Uapishka_3]